jgi:hypothetical protein
MPYQLARLRPRVGKTETKNDVIQTSLQQREQVLSGNARLLLRLAEKAPELLLQKAVTIPRLLFFPELYAAVGKPRTWA